MINSKFIPDFSSLYDSDVDSTNVSSQELQQSAASGTAPITDLGNNTAYRTQTSALESGGTQPENTDQYATDNLIIPMMLYSSPEECIEAAIKDGDETFIKNCAPSVAQYVRNNLPIGRFIPPTPPGLVNPISVGKDEAFAMAVLDGDVAFIEDHAKDAAKWFQDNFFHTNQVQQTAETIPIVGNTAAVNKNSLSPQMQPAMQKEAPAELKNIIPKAVPPEQGTETEDDLGIHKIQKTESNAQKNYAVMEKFLSMRRVINVNKKSYIFNGWHYESIDTADLYSLVMDICEDEISSSGIWKSVTETSNFIQSCPKTILPDEHVSDNLVSFKNGVLNLDTGELYPHSPEFITLYGVNANYLGSRPVSHITFDSYLSVSGKGDPAHALLLKQVMGCCLTPDMKAKRIFVLQGKSNTGKSVAISFLQSVLTKGAHLTLDAQEFAAKFALSELPGRVLCDCPDMPSDPLTPKAVSKFKQISGGDLISSDQKYKNRIYFKSRAKLVLVTNHRITTKTSDYAFMERIITIPFDNPVSRENMDVNLLAKLLAEKDAIVTDVINEYMKLRWDSMRREQLGEGSNYRFVGNFELNAVVEEDENTPFSIDDMVRDFVLNRIAVNENDRVNTRDAYTEFSQMYNISCEDLFNKLFNKYIGAYYGDYATQSRGPKNGASNGPRGFKGIVLKPIL